MKYRLYLNSLQYSVLLNVLQSAYTAQASPFVRISAEPNGEADAAIFTRLLVYECFTQALKLYPRIDNLAVTKNISYTLTMPQAIALYRFLSAINSSNYSSEYSTKESHFFVWLMGVQQQLEWVIVNNKPAKPQ